MTTSPLVSYPDVFAVLARHGITGTDAATSVQTALDRIACRPDLFDGIEVGPWLGLRTLVRVCSQLATQTIGMSAEDRLSVVVRAFGADACRVASVLMRHSGPEECPRCAGEPDSAVDHLDPDLGDAGVRGGNPLHGTPSPDAEGTIPAGDVAPSATGEGLRDDAAPTVADEPVEFSFGAFIETGPEVWLLGLEAAAALVARVAWPMENDEAQARWSGRLVNEPHIRRATEHQARRRFESAIAALAGPVEPEAAEAGWRKVTAALGYGDGITEPQISHEDFIAETEQLGREAADWRETQLWRNECAEAGCPELEDCYLHDPSLIAEKNAAAVARVEALHRRTHWCFGRAGGDAPDDLRETIVFEEGTEWWPCPTLAALAGPAETPEGGA